MNSETNRSFSARGEIPSTRKVPKTVMPTTQSTPLSASEMVTRELHGMMPEVGVVTFSNTAKTVVPMAPLSQVPETIQVEIGGSTNYGAGIKEALEKLNPTALIVEGDGHNNTGSYEPHRSRFSRLKVACVAFGTNPVHLAKIASKPSWVFEASKQVGQLGRVLAATTTMVSFEGNGMFNSGSHRIALVLDVSGSMSSWKSELERAYAQTIAELRKAWRVD